jgi:hypothetical protein
MTFIKNLSFGWKIAFLVLICFFVWLLSSYIMIRINYKPMFEWWNNNNGKNYDNLLNIFAICVANYSTPLYYLSKIFTNPLNQLDIAQTRFIIGQLLPYTTYVMDNKQYGILTPKSLCETVKLSRLDNDDLFNDWFDTNGKRGNPLLLIKEGAPLVYTQNPGVYDKKTGITSYTYSLVVNTGTDVGFYGLYPTTFDHDSWAGLILEWLGPSWVMQADADNILHPHPKPDTKNSLGLWFMNDGIGRGDNFIARMGMLPTCPLVVYFCNNQFSTQGMEVDPQAFANLLAPAGGIAGGWVGFLNGMSGASYDHYTNLIRTRTDDPTPPIPPNCKPPNIGNGIMSGITSGIGVASMAFFVPPPFGETAAIASFCGIAFMSLLTGALTGYQAGAGTC